MRAKKKAAGLFFLILAGIVFLAARFLAQETCTEFPISFTETFDATTNRDAANSSVNYWGERGYITLNPVGAEFNLQPALPGIPAWVNVMTANDFNGDGWTDLVVSSTDNSGTLVLVENTAGVFSVSRWILGGPGPVPAADPGFGALTSGDYDGDNDIDLFYVVSDAAAPYNIKRVSFFRNDGGVPPAFTEIPKTAAWGPTLGGLAWPASCLTTTDIDRDNDPDILIGNKNGRVFMIRNNGRTRTIDANNKWNDTPARTPILMDSVNPGWAGRGVSVVGAADFDGDNDVDLMVGSVSYAELLYYKNDGTGTFSLYTTYSDPSGDTANDFYDGGATVLLARDFDKDGDVDFIVGTDDFNYKPGAEGIGGEAYYFQNSKGDFLSRLIFDSRMDSPPVTDFDTGVALDYDHDVNGTTDVILTGGHNSAKLSQYPFLTTVNPDYFNLQGTAQSTNVTPGLDPALLAITRVRVRNLVQDVAGGSSAGLSVALYVSNNDGLNWELYERFEGDDIRSYPELEWHTFEHYGSRMKWKAVFNAADDGIAGSPNASLESPRIQNIDFEIIYVERREYSRTSVAATIVDDSGAQVKLIIGGTFYFPGWQGHLIAYDVTQMTPVNTTYSELRTVSSSNLPSGPGRNLSAGVTIRWDAGALLASRFPSSRVLYTALPTGGGSLARADFATTNDALDAYLQDTQGENDGLIDFIRGVGREWKLGDINHSNPVVVGPPLGSPTQMGDGYQEFRQALSGRKTVLYVGANDGFLHCFDILTGEELWGFVPFNLLPKLRNMWAVDADTQERYFARDVFVDGSPAVSDVFTGGQWRTILVCGQGPGRGSLTGGGINYYFALDVTNPENPVPLWELTAPTMGETWSVPAIGKVTKGGQPTWVAFMGSGYDNESTDPAAVLGNVFYAVDLNDGSIFWTFTADDVDTSDTARTNATFANIQNTMPGSPALMDMNRDGFVERVYIGDLDGRLWKVDLSPEFQSAGDWSPRLLFTDPDNYPIITKPALWFSSTSQLPDPRVFFGTGGDDAAPNLAIYSFVALIDSNSGATVEWFMGVPDAAGTRPDDKDVGDLSIGEKVWADPKVVDYTVYFSTLTGSIESVDPCSNLGGAGKLYARFLISIAGSAVGGTAFKTATGPLESLNLAIKTRSAVTVGEQQTTETGVRKREIYIQEYNSTIQKLEQATGGLLRVKSWREIYRIIKK